MVWDAGMVLHHGETPFLVLVRMMVNVTMYGEDEMMMSDAVMMMAFSPTFIK